MKLHELKADNFARFERIEDQFTRLNQMNAVLYIEHMGTITQNRIDNWDLQAVFGSGEGDLLFTDKNTINKLFFAEVSKLKDKPLEIAPEVLAALKSTATRLRERDKDTIRRKIESDEGKVREFYRELHVYNIRITDNMRAFEALSEPANEKNLFSSFEAIFKNPFFKNIRISGTRFLADTQEVVLKEKNPAAGLDYGVKLGEYTVAVELSSMSLTVSMLRNNISIGDYQITHPHVKNTAVCFGNMLDAYVVAQRESQVSKIFEIVHGILTNYNAGNPYQSLQQFYHKATSKNRIGTLSGAPEAPDLALERANREAAEREANRRAQLGMDVAAAMESVPGRTYTVGHGTHSYRVSSIIDEAGAWGGGPGPAPTPIDDGYMVLSPMVAGNLERWD